MLKKVKQPKKRKHAVNQHQIYGIYCFKTKDLCYISLDKESIELEYSIGMYKEQGYDIVSFVVNIN